MPQALDFLRQEHSNMAALLRVLERQLSEFQSGERPDYDLVRAILDYLLSFPDVCHHPKEDLIFDKLHDRDPFTAERIGDLRNAHDELAARGQKFATGLRAVLEEAEMPRETFIRLARRFIDLQQQHIDMEESVFFPAVEKTLTTTDWAELNALMARTEDAGGRFEQLRKTILQWCAEDEIGTDQGRDGNQHPSRKNGPAEHWR